MDNGAVITSDLHHTSTQDKAGGLCKCIFQDPWSQPPLLNYQGGVEIPNRVLLLQQSIYGLKQSPLNFYNHLRQGLASRGFTKSNHDDCIFANGEVIVLF